MPAPTLSNDLQTALDAVHRVAAAHHVARLEAFGSAVTGRLHEASDVDLLESDAVTNPFFLAATKPQRCLLYAA